MVSVGLLGHEVRPQVVQLAGARRRGDAGVDDQAVAGDVAGLGPGPPGPGPGHPAGRLPTARLPDAGRPADNSIESTGGPDLAPEANAYGWLSYLGERCGAADLESLAAPGRATDLAGLLPAYVVVGTVAGFVDEDVEFARGLLAAGVPVDLRVHAGLPHGFDVVAPRAPSTRRALRDLHDWLDQKFHPLA